MKVANNAIDGCIFVTYIDICKYIMFTVQADHHNISFSCMSQTTALWGDLLSIPVISGDIRGYPVISSDIR